MKKKRGSSLGYVLLITASVMVVGTACLSTLSMGLKTTIEENKRVQSLYGADAGIDWAKSLLIGTFQTATEYAEQQVKEVYKYNFDNSKLEELNLLFKEKFRDFIDTNKFNKENFINEFVQALNTKKYYNKLDKSSAIEIGFSNDEENIEPELEVISSQYTENDTYQIELKSTFESVDSGIKNERQISVLFEIKVPDFRGQYLDETVNIYPVYNDKVMAIDGDLNISDSNVIVSGDIFVVGNEVDKIVIPAYDKYKGGIMLTDSTLTSTDNIVTANTMNLISSSTVEGKYASDSTSEGVEKEPVYKKPSLYARNLYLGSTEATDYQVDSWTVKDNTVTLDEVIVDNDLAIKAKNSNVTIDKFYGINDKTYEELKVDAETSDINKTSKTSSSIIVNQKEGSSLTINDEAYIMGVAYIDTQGGKYETGESIAVKGNYIAYTQPLEDFSDTEFSYYEPLYLVDQVNNQPLTVIQKNDYFLNFAKQQANATDQDGVISLDKNHSVLSSGGVNLEKADVYAVGAIVHTDGESLLIEKAKMPKVDVVLNKQIEFANMVYNMGKDYNPQESEDRLGLYQSETQLKVANSINFDLLEKRCKQNASLCKGSDLFIHSSKQAINLSEQIGKCFTGIILTNSDVVLDSDFTLNGILMTTGTVTITNKTNTSQKSNIELNYDRKVVQTIISRNYELFDDVFNQSTSIENTDVNGFLEYDSKNYDPTKFISMHHWKLVH